METDDSFDGFEDFNDFQSRSKLSLDQFDFLVEKFNLKPTYSVEKMDDDVVINEEWSSDINDSIRANRIYKFDVEFIDIIQDNKKVDILNAILDIYVSDENYEEAAVIRDAIKTLV